MKKHIKKRIAGLLLAATLVFSGVTPAAYAEPASSKPNKVSGNAMIAQNIAEEGTVLLKNDYNALPLKKSDIVAGLGIRQYSQRDLDDLKKTGDPQIFGGGGSGWVNADGMTSYYNGLTYAALRGFIKSYEPIASAAQTKAFTKIIYFVGRSTTEGADLRKSEYYLDDAVKSDISELIARYGKERIIVVLNMGTVCDTTWLIEKDVAAIVAAYYGGEQAGTALANVLTGAVTPSGKTVDTWAKDYDYYPSSDGSGIGTFAGDKNTYYTEDVYVGYRYFSTFDPNYEKVNYEFGYGLSYTKFRMDDYSCSYKDGTFTVSANVTNIGAYSGKEVLQAYFEAPDGVMGAPKAELAGFAKTELLKPGQSQKLDITFDEKDFARYDDRAKIAEDSWVIEKGDYLVRAGNSVKDAYSRDAVYTHNVAENKVIEKTTKLRDTTLNKRLLSDGSYEQLGETASLAAAHTVPEAGGIVVQAEDYSAKRGEFTASEYFYSGTIEGVGLGGLNRTENAMVTYDLYVEKAGTYGMAFNFSSAWDGQNDMFEIYVNDEHRDITVSMDATHTSDDGLWHTYTHLSSPNYKIDLPQGEVKLKFVGNGLKFMNFDCFWLYSNNVSPDKATTVQAVTFTSSSGSINVFPDGAATSPANEAWQSYEYALNVEKAGKYYLSLRASNVTQASDDAMYVSVNGEGVDAKIALPRTAANGNVLESNYYTFTDTAPVAIDLPAGNVTLVLETNDSALCSMESFTLIPESAYTPTDYTFTDNTDEFEYITDLGGSDTVSVTYDDVYADPELLDEFVAQMPVDQLVHLTGLDLDQNDAQTGTGGVGGSHMNLEYGIPFTSTSDGPAGIRYVNGNLYSTWFPCMTMLASTWNTELAYAFGQGVALEASLGGVGVWLAPGVNIHRNPLCGRNFEYFSEDPLVAGLFASQITLASQSYGVSVCVKHYVGNEQETNRFANNSNVSARALREIYLKPFEIAVKTAHPYSIMSSYNKVNGLHAASSYDLITGVLRDDWGFDGAVLSDWGASMSHIANIKAGNTFKSSNPHYDELVKAYQSCVLTREDLERNAKDAVRFLMLSSAGRQKITVIDYEFINELGDGNITRSVVTADGKKKAFIRFSVTEAGYYRIDTISAEGTVTAHSGDFTVGSDPTYLSVGAHEFAIEYTGDSVGVIGMKKVAAPVVVDPDPEKPDPPVTPDKPVQPDARDDADDGLSGGAIAGIVIGSVAAAAALAGGAWYVTKRRKGAKSPAAADNTTDEPTEEVTVNTDDPSDEE